MFLKRPKVQGTYQARVNPENLSILSRTRSKKPGPICNSTFHWFLLLLTHKNMHTHSDPYLHIPMRAMHGYYVSPNFVSSRIFFSFLQLKAVNHPANSGGLPELKLNYNFWYFLFWFWGCVCKDIQPIQKDVPPKKVFGNSEFWSSRQNHSSLNY